MKKNIVVIGNGMVGFKFCEKMTSKELDSEYQVITFAEEKIPAYDRVHLSEYIEGKSSDELSLAAKSWYEEHNITLHLGDKVVDIDRSKKVVYSQKGLEISYDKLVFATGSAAFVPPIKGVEKKESLFIVLLMI